MTKRRHRLIIFTRAPLLGRVKTRLAAELGDEQALTIYESLARRTIEATSQSAAWHTTIQVDPPDAERIVREWLGAALELRAQADGDLGERMRAAVAEAKADGASRVVVIGTDCPDVNADVVSDAFARLDRADVVLGPAVDGGYYLIGVHEPHRLLFASIPWSSPETTAATLRAARTAGLRVELLPVLSDVDTAADWRAWNSGRRGAVRPVRGGEA